MLNHLEIDLILLRTKVFASLGCFLAEKKVGLTMMGWHLNVGLCQKAIGDGGLLMVSSDELIGSCMCRKDSMRLW